MRRLSIFCSFVMSLFFIGTNTMNAQNLIIGLDTICVDNPIQLSSNDTLSNTHYWGFCSAYLQNIPQGSSIAAGTGLNAPSSIAMEKDGNSYYVFVVNSGGNRDVIRYEFGSLLSNAPTVTNLGNFSNKIPTNPTGMQLTNDGNNWYGFILGGNVGNYHIIRLNFGTSLNNTPTATDLGNLTGSIVAPQDFYVFKQGGNWHATLISNNGNVQSLHFGTSLNNVPTVNLLTNVGGNPTGMWPVLENGNWFVFYVDNTNHSLHRINFGNNLANPTIALISTQIAGLGIGTPLTNPKDVSFIKDCGVYYAFVTNEGDNTITQFTFNSVANAPIATTNVGNFAGLNSPQYLTRYIRDKDNVFSFTANKGDNSISRLEYNSCIIPSSLSSNLLTPPAVNYPIAGTYNIYYVGDEGLPTMKVDCKLLTVLPKPFIEITADTAICQGDTLRLIANGIGALHVNWTPVYNAILPVDTTTIFVYPKEDFTYNAYLEFLPNGGCLYDTFMTVSVNKIEADAGPDVFVADGAITTLGGPNTSYGLEFKYKWRPALYLSDTITATPTCTPLDVQAYYFEVFSDSSRCVAYDTVWVKTECNEINLPNAFNPTSDITKNRNFGLENYNIYKLTYFRIYNRWGNLLFETTDPKKKWDGTYNNIDVSSDNYVWTIDGYCSNGKHIVKNGTVLLVR